MKDTPTKKIINIFINKKATREQCAINVEEINVDIKNNEKKYIVDSLIKSQYLIVTNNNKIWFDENKWNKAIKKLTIQYSLILVAPIIIAIILHGAFF